MKFPINEKELENYIFLNGIPPKNSSCRTNNGYWVVACKTLLGKGHVSMRHIRAVASRYYSNVNGLRKRIEESVSQYNDREVKTMAIINAQHGR